MRASRAASSGATTARPNRGSSSRFRQARDIFAPAFRPQLAGRTMSAAVAPIMTDAPLAEITGVSGLVDDRNQRFASDLLGEAPGGGLVEPHQRGLDVESRVH